MVQCKTSLPYSDGDINMDAVDLNNVYMSDPILLNIIDCIVYFLQHRIIVSSCAGERTGKNSCSMPTSQDFAFSVLHFYVLII